MKFIGDGGGSRTLCHLKGGMAADASAPIFTFLKRYFPHCGPRGGIVVLTHPKAARSYCPILVVREGNLGVAPSAESIILGSRGKLEWAPNLDRREASFLASTFYSGINPLIALSRHFISIPTSTIIFTTSQHLPPYANSHSPKLLHTSRQRKSTRTLFSVYRPCEKE